MVADQEEIHRLSLSEDVDDREKAIEELSDNFKDLRDISAAWSDLHGLTRDKDDSIRRIAPRTIASVFKFVPDKSAALDDLIRLTKDKNSLVRSGATYSLGIVFPFIPDEFKRSVWSDLHRLSSDKDSYIRCTVGIVFIDFFEFLPDKSMAWCDLKKLITDENLEVRQNATFAIDSAFEYISEKHKSEAWDNLHMLISDTDSYIREYANYSLGKICIYKASKSENENSSRALLEDAINYFEHSMKDEHYGNPARFCYPFYCSFDAILFKKVNSKKEIYKHIEAAKEQIGKSECKEKLIEAIEQLSGILEMAHNAKEEGMGYQELFKLCSDIFSHVEQLMNENRNKTPAIHGLYKIAKPSFDKTITELINKVKETATIAYEEAKGTPAEDVACLVKKETQRWDVTDQNLMAISLDLIIDSLKSQIPDIPDYKGIRGQIDQIKSHTEVQYQMLILSTVISQLPTISFAAKTYETVTRTENKVDSILQTVTELKDFSSKLKEEGNEKESKEISDIADKIKALFDSGDKKDIAFFIEKLREKVPTLLEEIDKSNAPNYVKEKAKMDLKEKIMKSGKDISLGVVTNWIAAYLPSIVGAGASGLLVPGIILVALLSIESMRDKK